MENLTLGARIKKLVEHHEAGYTATAESIRPEDEALWILSCAEKTGVDLQKFGTSKCQLQDIARRHFIGQVNALMENYKKLEEKGEGFRRAEYWGDIVDKIQNSKRYFLSEADRSKLLEAFKQLCYAAAS